MLRNLLACLLCLVLASCFDIREEIWIHEDGSGRMQFDYAFPSEALLVVGGTEGIEGDLRKIFDAEPDLRLNELTIEPDGDDIHLRIVASTDSLLALRDLKESHAFQALPRASSDLAGTFEVKVRGLAIDARRTIDFQRALGLAALAIGKDQRDRRHVTYIFHLPTPALEHNATRTEDAGRTLVWQRTLGEALDQPLVTQFRTRIPLPWWTWALLVLVIALPAVLIILWRRRRSARP